MSSQDDEIKRLNLALQYFWNSSLYSQALDVNDLLDEGTKKLLFQKSQELEELLAFKNDIVRLAEKVKG